MSKWVLAAAIILAFLCFSLIVAEMAVRRRRLRAEPRASKTPSED